MNPSSSLTGRGLPAWLGSLAFLLTLPATSAHAAVDTWEGSGPFATGAGNRLIHALAVGPDGVVYAGTGSGTVFRYEPANTVPGAFSFTSQTGIAPGTQVTSDDITVSGINTSSPIAIAACTATACEYQVNNGAWLSVAGSVVNGDIVRVRQTASASYSTQTVLTLEIGTVSASFSVTTVAAPIPAGCGPAASQPTLLAPSAGLCATGTPGSVTSAVDHYGWTCAGALGGADANCQAPRQYTVTPSAGAHGTVTPAGAQLITYGASTSFTITPDSGYVIASVSGCGGSLSNGQYTTAAVSGDCSISASFTPSGSGGPGQDPACGSAAGQPSLLAPGTGLCVNGSAGPVSSHQGQHHWNCAGNNTSVQCQAPGVSYNGVYVTLGFDNTGSCLVEHANLISPPAGGPAGISLPHGALDFSLTGCAPGSTVQVTASYSGSLAGMSYWKYRDDAWHSMPASVSGNSVTFSIADNGPWDTDPQSGRIADPSGPGQAGAPGPGISEVPLLAPWALALLGLMMGAGSAFFRRTGEARQSRHTTGSPVG